MATITEPDLSSPAGRAIAVSPRQALHLVASASSTWSFRVNGGAWSTITTATEIFWTTPASVTNRFTFDRIDVAIGADPDAPEDTRTLNLVEGPAAVLVATASIRNEAMEEPPLRPWEGEDDDPPHGVPLAMLGANRDRVGTVLLETVSEQGGPANLFASFGPGLFVDTAGKVGCRTPFTNDARGFGPFPAIAAYHHGGLYFNHDFGKSRTLGLTRVLYQDGSGHVAIVRGDGRRNTYRSLGGGAFTPAAALRNTLAEAGGIFTETTPSGRVYRYLSTGALDRVIDRAGNAVYYRYDSNSRLQKIEGPTAAALGLVPYLSYNGSGLLERLVLEDSTTPANNRTSYLQYDGDRNLIRIIGPEQCITYFTYTGDAARLASVTDPDGFVWRAAYDGNDRVDRVVDALDASAYFAFDPATAVATHKDRAGDVTYFRHTAWGSPDRVYDLGTPADYFMFDGDGNLTRAKNRLGNEWVYEYDGVSSRISATDPLGARHYFAYDSLDLLRYHTDPIGRTTTLDYDGTRNRTKTIDPIGNATYYEYEPTGLLRYRKDRRGAFTYFAWDDRATLSKVNDPLGHTTYFAYNSANETTAQVDPLGRITYLEHDQRGRVVKQTNPIGAATYFAYDSRCNLVSQTDALLRSTLHVYDGNSNRTKSVDALGHATYLAYDAEERVTGQKNARLFETTFTYDALGRRQKTIDALGFETYLAYDAAHELERQVDARGHAAYFRYDAAGRLTHQEDALGNETYLGFDLAAQRVLTTDPRGHSTVFQYDPRGWQRRTETAIGAVTYVVFDEEGNRLRQVDPLGKTTYSTYDLAGRMTHTKDQLLGMTYIGYDRASQAVLRTDELGAATYLSYDAAGRSQTTRTPAGLLTYTAYDLVGNVSFTNVDHGWGRQPWGSSPWGGQRTTTYHSYDAINRRQKTTDAYAGVTYMVYDRVGNVDFTVDARGFGTYHTYDALNRRTHTKDGVHFAQTYMGFDQVGNVVRQVDQEGVTTYLTYDAVNRVQFSHDPAGALTYHVFDAASNRTETHVLLGAGGERRSTYMQYDPVNRTIKRIAADGGETYFEHDLVGNQVRVVDPVGRPTYLAYDELNRQSTRQNALGNTWTTTYDARSSVLRQIDPEGRTAYMGYDPARRLLHQSNALGEFSYFFYDARGARTHVLNPRGHSTYMRYDLLGRQTHTIDALGGVSYMAYDATGNRTLAQDELGHATYFAYDGLGRTTHVKDALFNTNYLGYDSRSSIVLGLDPEGRPAYMTYDLANRLSTRGNALGQTSYHGYDQVSEPVIAVDPRGNPTYLRYDRVGRQTHKIDALGGVRYMVYDASGSLTLAQDELLNATYFTYDLRNRLSTTTDALFRTTYLGYDSESVVLRVDADGRATYLGYDAAWRLERQYHNVLGGEAETKPSYFVYDGAGNPTIVDDRLAGLGVTYFDRDALDRVVKKTTIAGAVYYEYDPRGLKVAFKDADLSKNYYVYDAAGRLVREWLDDARTAYFHHDASGQLTTKILPQTLSNKLMTYHSYDVAGRLNRLESHAVVGGTPSLITYFAYQRDANGQKTWVRNEGGQNSYFEYDALDRLTLDERKSSSATLYGFRYAYDLAGNRDRKVTIHESNSRTYYVYDTRNLLVKEGVEGAGTAIYYDFDNARRMTAMRPTGADVQSAYFAHDQRNRATGIAFTKATSPDTTRSFGYSGAGERVFATDDTTTYWQHDGQKLVREGSTSAAMVRSYRRSDPVEIAMESGAKVYPAADEQGSVRKFVEGVEGIPRGESYTDQFGVKLAESNSGIVEGLGQVRTRWMGSSVSGLNTTNDDFYLTGSGIYLPGSGRPTTFGIFVPFRPWREGPLLPPPPRDPGPRSKDCPYPTEPVPAPFTRWMLIQGWPDCLWAPHGWKQDDPGDDPAPLDESCLELAASLQAASDTWGEGFLDHAGETVSEGLKGAGEGFLGLLRSLADTLNTPFAAAGSLAIANHEVLMGISSGDTGRAASALQSLVRSHEQFVASNLAGFKQFGGDIVGGLSGNPREGGRAIVGLLAMLAAGRATGAGRTGVQVPSAAEAAIRLRAEALVVAIAEDLGRAATRNLFNPTANVLRSQAPPGLRAGRPGSISVIFDIETGKLTITPSGPPPTVVHPLITGRIGGLPLGGRPPLVCAEIQGVNQMLLHGSQIKNLVGATTNANRGGVHFPRCDNCRATTAGMDAVTDPR